MSSTVPPDRLSKQKETKASSFTLPTEEDSTTPGTTIERRIPTIWSFQPITSAETSGKTHAHHEEDEEKALKIAQNQISLALKGGQGFQLTSCQFKAVSDALQKTLSHSSKYLATHSHKKAPGKVSESLCDCPFERRVRFLALVGDYAGRLCNGIRIAANKLGFEDFPKYAEELREALVGKTNDTTALAVRQVCACIDWLNKECSDVRKLNLDVDTVLLAAELYAERNQKFHSGIGSPGTKDNKSKVKNMSESHQREFKDYLEEDKAGDAVFIERVKRIMTFYPVDMDAPYRKKH